MRVRYGQRPETGPNPEWAGAGRPGTGRRPAGVRCVPPRPPLYLARLGRGRGALPAWRSGAAVRCGGVERRGGAVLGSVYDRSWEPLGC